MIRRERHGRFREQREREAHQAVGAHLQQHAGQNHRAGGRRLHVRVGQPGVQREQRHLDREGQREGEEQPGLRAGGDRQRVELQQIEAVDAGRRLVEHGERDDGDQHQHAAGHRVEQELHRRVDALVVAPDADEEIHRNQHRVPEHVEQEQVEREEHAQHARFEQEHEDRELFDLALDVGPGRQQRERRQEAGEDDEHQADAVDAEVILDAERRDPRVAFDELEVGGAGREAGPQRERRGEGDERHPERDVADEPVLGSVAVADQQEQHRAQQRQKDNQTQHGQYFSRSRLSSYRVR